MVKLRDRRDDPTTSLAEPTRARPVVLATLAVRVHPSAERMAIDSAIDAGVPLVLVNLIPLPSYTTTMVYRSGGPALPHEEAPTRSGKPPLCLTPRVPPELLRRTKRQVRSSLGGGA